MSKITEPTDRLPRWLLAAAAVSLAALGGAYAFLRSSRALEWHALIGDSLSPVAAILSVVAVLAALWSVHVQRQELALQREELRETREEMKAQREQFERTARAQEALARSQRDLAVSQQRANRIGILSTSGQFAQNVATLMAARAAIRSQIEDLRSRSGNFGEAYARAMKGTLDGLDAQLEIEQKRIKAVTSAIKRPDDDAIGSDLEQATGESGDG